MSSLLNKLVKQNKENTPSTLLVATPQEGNLFQSQVETKLKICGFTNSKDVSEAVNIGVEFLGFNFVEKSPRFINFESFLKIYSEASLKAHKSKLVAIVSDQSVEFVEQIIASKTIDIIQFHGQETPQFLKQFKGRIEIWKAIICNTSEPDESIINQVKLYENITDWIVLDVAKNANLTSGVQVFNRQSLYKQLSINNKLVLAGGLNPDNVEEFLEDYNPEIIDIASGAEIQPGIKDFFKIQLLQTKIQ